MNTESSIKKLRDDAAALDEIGPVAWDDADAKRRQAAVMEAQLPYFDVRAARLLSVGCAVIAGVVTYAVSGADLVRTGIAAFLWLAIGWYTGKSVFPRKRAE